MGLLLGKGFGEGVAGNKRCVIRNAHCDSFYDVGRGVICAASIC